MKWQVVVLGCVACACIAGMETTAIIKGLDGTALAGAMTAVGAIVTAIVTRQVSKPKDKSEGGS